MRILPNGDLQTAPSELITVRVTKSVAPYQTAISPLAGAVWASAPGPAGLTEVRTFQAPAAAGARATFTIDFEFLPDATGAYDPNDQYVVEIKGDPAGSTRTQPIYPPPPVSQFYQFVVQAQQEAGGQP
jgi:hypothetical protein